MELQLVRKEFSNLSTIGELSIDGVFECFTLEDCDRGLNQAMSHEEIESHKVYGLTCIPYGKYEVIKAFSPHFKREMPLLKNIPGYAGVLIHTGNVPVDTLGCILLGQKKLKDKIIQSSLAFAAFYPKFEKAILTEKIFITITKQ